MIKTILRLYIIIVLTCLILSCGKKGPPVAPSQKPIPVVRDLGYRIDGGIITLSWTVPVTKGKEEPTGFFVYRSKNKIDGSECENCPIRYVQTADIPAKKRGGKFEYREHLEKDFIYYYKVTVYIKNRIEGKDSNIVKIIYLGFLNR